MVNSENFATSILWKSIDPANQNQKNKKIQNQKGTNPMKTNKFLATIFAIVLCICTLVPMTAFAANPNLEGGALVGSEANPAEAAITKILKMPEGTSLPTDLNFTFNVEAKTADAPAISTVTIPYSSGTTSATSGGVVSVSKESASLFAGKTFPHAGEYVYEITETTAPINTSSVKLTCSAAKYALTVYVKNNAAGTGTFVFAIGAVVITKGSEEHTQDGKVDPTPGGYDSEYTYSQLTFTNTYAKTNGAADPEDPDPTADSEATLTVSNAITGAFGNKNLYFDYSMTLTAPSLVSAPAFYRAYVVENGAVINPANNAEASLIGTDAAGSEYSYIEISTSAATAFKLKDGQKLVFVDTPVGTIYSISETGAAAYDASVVVTTNGSAAAPIGGASTGANVATGTQSIGEAANKAVFSNARGDVTPMGLRLSDIPFIGMIVLALGALTGFIIFKSRKRSYNR